MCVSMVTGPPVSDSSAVNNNVLFDGGAGLSACISEETTSDK